MGSVRVRKEYTCDLCKHTFMGDRSEDAAIAEFEQTFHKRITDVKVAVLCHDCYKLVMENYEKRRPH